MTRFFWVNLGLSYKEVLNYKFLWAPRQSNKNGKPYTNAGWLPIRDVKKGDVIFCNEKSNIIYIAIALSDAYPAPRPENRAYSEWNGDGFKVDVHLIVLEGKIEVSTFKDEFIHLFNKVTIPKVFTKNGLGSQTYMSALPASAGAYLLDLLGDESLKIQEEKYSDPSNDTKAVSLGSSREVVAKARVGQGKYRKEVLELWNGKCAVTNVSQASLLTASHIYSWQLSNPVEKCDPFNGLPLSPNLDKLFDLGLISFEDDGHILFSDKVDEETLHLLNVHKEMKIKNLKPENKKYLKRHREIHRISK